MTSVREPTSIPILATNAVIIPTANLGLVVPNRGRNMSINAIITKFACVPFRTRRRFNNPGHCRDLFLREFIVVGILTRWKETLREVIFVARFLGKISNEAQ
jgi:hypothetical protein